GPCCAGRRTPCSSVRRGCQTRVGRSFGGCGAGPARRPSDAAAPAARGPSGGRPPPAPATAAPPCCPAMTESRPAGTEAAGDERPGAGREMDEGRVLALSDGVFAIAATLLVLDLRVPDGLRPAELPDRLHELLPSVGGYALSYLLIGLLWLGHHRQFRSFRRIGSRVARLNLLFL